MDKSRTYIKRAVAIFRRKSQKVFRNVENS